MANEKLYTAKQAAEAVLKRTSELLVKSEFMKAEMAWKKPEKDAEQHAEGKAPKGEIHPKEKEQAPSDDVRTQAAPEKNPKEQAEGNNELAGTTPTQVGPDGKNKPGFAEMQGHLKLAKFIGHMESKRKSKAVALPEINKNEVLEKSGYRAPGVKGIHGTDKFQVPKGTKEANSPGQSAARHLGGKHAVEAHKKVLGEMKDIKPNLPKSEDMDKGETGHEKGVNLQSVSEKPGVSSLGGRVRNKDSAVAGPDTAKKHAVGTLMQQAKIKPKLPG